MLIFSCFLFTCQRLNLYPTKPCELMYFLLGLVGMKHVPSNRLHTFLPTLVASLVASLVACLVVLDIALRSWLLVFVLDL